MNGGSKKQDHKITASESIDSLLTHIPQLE